MISAQSTDSTNGEFVLGDALRFDFLSQFWKRRSIPDMVRELREPGGAEPADGQPLSFSSGDVPHG
jgi:hypothetical protein